MAIVAGIDEAGFGPILGPLVVSSAAFAVDDDGAERCLWERLQPAVSKKVHKHFTGLTFADSKHLYTPSRGLTWLERGVLGWVNTWADGCEELSRLLRLLQTDLDGQLGQYPWYDGADLPLPSACDATDLRLRANALGAALRDGGIQPMPGRSVVLLVGRYNQLVAAMDNKAAVLLDQTARLIYELVRNRGEHRRLLIQIDRQGGRQHYRPMLQRLFPEASLKITEETDGNSGYSLRFNWGQLDICFRTGGEDHWLPIALASMTSKYLRELLMTLVNRFWAGHVEGLKPTSGYFTDGKRFLEDIAAARATVAVAEELLIRSR